jgi:O-Antigen ligase
MRPQPASAHRGMTPIHVPAQPVTEVRDVLGPQPATVPRSTRIIPFTLGCVILSNRAFVVVSSGGHGVLPLLAVVAPLAAIVSVSRYGRGRSLGFLEHPVFVMAVLPYLALTAVFPILGVMFHGYPERTLLSIADSTTAVSFLVLGAAAASSDRRSWARWLMLGIVLQLAYALGQAIYWSRGPGWEAFTPFAGWDLSLAVLQGQLGSLGRSTGLFTNPNDLGLWAGVAVVLAWTTLPQRQRGIGIALSVMTLLLSQSRGPAVGLLAALVAGAALSVARGRFASSAAFKTVLAFVLAGLLATLAGVFVAAPEVLLDRFGALFQVLMAGPQADANLASRLNLWSGVVVLNSAYPWGTWGSPELLLGTAVDSAWFRAFAQGSVPYVATLALLFAAALALRDPSHGDALRLIGVTVAVAGLTQTPFGSPVIAIFWVLLGVYMQSSVAARRSARSQRLERIRTQLTIRAIRRPQSDERSQP